ncbi:MAG: DUF4340 domain-containing protein [Deltaproteobacteria bacterium]|nr:DUF4340 domain-containing protein [Deltaproteobacteria bacterium]
MSFRNTAILAVVVALLGAYLYFVERPALEKGAEKELLLEVEPDLVTRVEMVTADGAVEIAREEETWKIVAPVQAAADQKAVEALVRTVAEAEQKRVVDESPESLAPFGLEAPEVLVKLTGKSGPLPALAIGNAAPIGFNAYARRGDEPAVLLTTGTTRSALDKKLKDLRDKTILTVDEAGVEEITLRPADGEAVVLRKDGESWQIREPIEARADGTKVQSLLGSLRALRATDFVAETGAEALAARGLAPPQLEIVVQTTTEPKEKRLLVGAEIESGDEAAPGEGSVKQVAATSPPSEQIYLVATHVLSSLGKTASDLRDKTVVRVAAEDVSSVDVKRADGEGYELVKKDGGWSLAGDLGAETDPLVAQRFVDDVFATKGETVASESGDRTPFGLATPAMTITLRDAKGGDLGALVAGLAGDDDGLEYFVAAAGDGPVFAIRDFNYRRIDKKPGELTQAGTDNEDAGE